MNHEINPIFQLNELSQTSTKVKNMFEIVFDLTGDKEKREKAADNLVVLARERSGAEMLHKEGAVPQIARLMKVEQNVTIRLSLIRSIGEMCKKSQEIARSVLKECGVPFFLDILNSNNEEVVNASSYIIQVNISREMASFVYIFKLFTVSFGKFFFISYNFYFNKGI